MIDKTTFIICSNNFLNQTIASIKFGKWGNPLDVDIRFVKEWKEVHSIEALKEYVFLIKSGTVFTDIELFFQELSPILLKTGIGHITYNKASNSIELHDQALLIKSNMIPETFGTVVQDLRLPNFTKSEKNVHHDYTPVYVKADDGYHQIEQSKFGQDVIADHLNKHQYFNNFPNVLRQYKVYMPNKDVHDPFVEYKKMITNTLWVFNNESLKVKDTQKVLCTAGGIGWMIQTANTIHICDINKMQLKFVDECIKKWDGINFGEFVYNFILKNTVKHFHVNLNETQHSDIELLKDRDKFIDKVNKNLEKLLQKYRPGVDVATIKQDLQSKKIICEEKNILECVQKYHIDDINLSNILDFKYNYVTDNIEKWKNLVSPATKMFIKSCGRRQNPYKDAPCEPVDLNVPVAVISKEIRAINKYLVTHREESGIGWSSFCIHGKSYDATKQDEFYNDKRPHKWSKQALEHMPQTVAWLKTLGYDRFQRVRVMCLAPKGFINVHRDQTESNLGAVNVAITHPTGCKFYLEHHGELVFEPGLAYRLNLVNYHAVVNPSDEYRYHIIIHGDKK